MAANKTSGSAASFADLETAIETFLVASCGWAAAAGPAAAGGLNAQRLWTKTGLVVRVAVESTRAIHFTGATGTGGGTSTGDMPTSVKLGSPVGGMIAFPLDYEVVWNDTPEEVYITISYNGDKFQHANFGKSDVPGVGGSGMWITAAYAGTVDLDGASSNLMYIGVYRDVWGGGYIGIAAYAGLAAGFFQASVGGGSADSSYINCALEGAAAWRKTNNNLAGKLVGNLNCGDLLMALPSQFNEAEVLLNIYATLRRTDGVNTVVAVMRHARVMRIDNVDAEEVVIYGSGSWKCYPWYSKNTAARNGVAWSTGAPHSGTFGVAVRYPV